jgi:hypothetical protein
MSSSKHWQRNGRRSRSIFSGPSRRHVLSCRLFGGMRRGGSCLPVAWRESGRRPWLQHVRPSLVHLHVNCSLVFDHLISNTAGPHRHRLQTRPLRRRRLDQNGARAPRNRRIKHGTGRDRDRDLGQAAWACWEDDGASVAFYLWDSVGCFVYDSELTYHFNVSRRTAHPHLRGIHARGRSLPRRSTRILLRLTLTRSPFSIPDAPIPCWIR